MKQYLLIIFFCLFTKSIFAQGWDWNYFIWYQSFTHYIEDSLCDSYKPTAELIIKNRIKEMDYTGSDYKYIQKYDTVTGNLLEGTFNLKLSFWKDSLLTINKINKDSLLITNRFLYYYSGRHRDSMVSIGYQRQIKKLYCGFDTLIQTEKYDGVGRKIINHIDSCYKGKLKYYDIDSGKTKYSIIIFPPFDTTNYYVCDPSSFMHGRDVITYLYDDKKRISKIKSLYDVTTFYYKKDTILIECKTDEGDNSWKYKRLLCYKNGDMVKHIYLFPDSDSGDKFSIGFLSEYFYKNHLLTKYYDYENVSNDENNIFYTEKDMKKRANKFIVEVKIINY